VNRLLVLLLFLSLGCARGETAEEDLRVDDEPKSKPVACVNDWTAVASGIEYRMLNCTPSRFDLHLVRVDPKVAEIDAVVRPGSTATDLGREFTFALNANFFDEQFHPLGVVVTSGKEVNRLHPVSWQSVFFVDSGRTPRIVPMKEWDDVRQSAIAASQCGPRLVVDGEKNRVARAEPAWRSGVCIGPQKRVIFFATPPEVEFDVHEMVGLAAGPLRCRDAMLFDGGPSTQMYLRRQPEPVEVRGDKRVPAYVVVR
jgi:uncharacterized protein YigE (DUF2233 family)